MITAIHKSIATKRDAIKNEDKGFTLIELLVVVLIIGILAAIAIPAFLGQQVSARNGAAQQDVSSAKVAILGDIVDNGAFPTTGVITTLGDFTPTDDVTVTLSGTAAAWCVQARHAQGDTTYGAADDTATAAGTCAAGVFTPAP